MRKKSERERNTGTTGKINKYLSIITLNVNRLNAPIKWHRVAEWIRKHDPDLEDGGNIGESRIHFPSVPGKYLADLRSRANSQQYSSIYED